MKLTPELIARSQSALNALQDRELDLRGHKIPAIENLGVTRVSVACARGRDRGLCVVLLLRERAC